MNIKLNKNEKLTILLCSIVATIIVLSLISFTVSVYYENKDINNSEYQLLEIDEYEIAGTDRMLKVVRIMQVGETDIYIHDIECYTEQGVNEVLGRLLK